MKLRHAIALGAMIQEAHPEWFVQVISGDSPHILIETPREEMIASLADYERRFHEQGRHDELERRNRRNMEMMDDD